MTVEVKGVIPAVVTPFDNRYEINETVFKELLERLMDSGVHGLFIIGSQGEFYALSKAEKLRLMELAVATVNGRVPLYAGTGANTTKEAVDLSCAAESIGVDAVSVITPMFTSPNPEELYSHYTAIARAVDIPVILYSNPRRTGVELNPDLVGRLSRVENIRGIKDSSGDLNLTMDYIIRASTDFSVLAGNDSLILGTLVYGGKGAVAATANVVPELVVEIYERYMKGDLPGALEAQRKLVPLRRAFEFGTFPGVIKEALNMIGIEVGPTRLPVSPLSPERRTELRELLRSLAVHCAK